MMIFHPSTIRVQAPPIASVAPRICYSAFIWKQPSNYSTRFTIMGDDAGQIVEKLKPLGPAAFGANCGVGPDVAVRLAQRSLRQRLYRGGER